MEDYKLFIGEKVISRNGNTGVSSKIDKNGYICIRFKNELIEQNYMYDPFINGDLKFENSDLQKKIDERIAHINDNLIKLRDNSIAAPSDTVTYYFTRKNQNNEDEIICRLKCDVKDAFSIFNLFIDEEKKEFEKSGRKLWRQLKLFDSVNSRQIAQES